MKILYGHYLGDPCHPAAQMVETIAKELRALGHEVDVHAPRSADSRAWTPHMHWKWRPTWLKKYLWFSKEARADRVFFSAHLAAIDRHRPDVVLARQDAYRCSLHQAALCRNVPCVTYADAPVACEARRYPLGGRWHPPRLVERRERWNLEHSRASITVSRPAKQLLEQYGVPRPIRVAWNGINPGDYPTRDPMRIVTARAAVGLHPAATTVGFVGSFRAFHGMRRLNDLMASTRGRADVQWLLVGDGPERNALESANSGRNVVFVGRRAAEHIPEHLELMDIAVAPHECAGDTFYFCPLKILEAAAAGCAPLAARAGDIPELVGPEAAGQLCAPDDTADWTQRLQTWCDDAKARAAIGAAARAHVMSCRTWRHTAEIAAEVLTEALARPVSAAVPQARFQRGCLP